MATSQKYPVVWSVSLRRIPIMKYKPLREQIAHGATHEGREIVVTRSMIDSSLIVELAADEKRPEEMFIVRLKDVVDAVMELQTEAECRAAAEGTRG